MAQPDEHQVRLGGSLPVARPQRCAVDRLSLTIAPSSMQSAAKRQRTEEEEPVDAAAAAGAAAATPAAAPAHKQHLVIVWDLDEASGGAPMAGLDSTHSPSLPDGQPCARDSHPMPTHVPR